jgi:TetR/AcrR family transcriptional repressor of nem operon
MEVTMGKGGATRARIVEVAEQLLFEQGYSGTSLNDVMAETQLSKGAFFHHFKNKAELAHAVLGQWADNDDDLVREFAGRAEALAENPLQEATIFIKLFEEWLSGLDAPLKGCLFASFTYESGQFQQDMHSYIHDRLHIWMGLYHGIFEKLVTTYPPKLEGVTAESLTEMLATMFEGGLLLNRALADDDFLVRQLRQFRQMLTLMFDD